MPGVVNVHFPSQPVFVDAGATGTSDSHVGVVPGVPVHAMFAALPWSTNVTFPPLAIVTDFVGCGFDPDSAVQHGQLFSTQFSLTSSFASGGAVAPASAGTAAMAAPSTAATGR